MARFVLTDEDKAGKKIADIMSDSRLDANLVGESLGTSQPVDILNRLALMVNGMYVSRERFRQALGEASSEISEFPLIEDENENTDDEETSFETRCEILGELWVEYKNDEEFEDFIQYNDLGLPLAYAISTGINTPTVKSKKFINETWKLFLEKVEVEDSGFDGLDEILILQS